MKRGTSAFFLLLSLVAAAWAQPKIAVLDARIPKGRDYSAVIPVTEKVMERLVLSGHYIVLDRANVDQVLREREFQVSGLVSDDQISEAGKYLGADFVVVIRVQRVEDTYFLSAKMIAVKSGVILNQSSAEGKGKTAVLIKLAEQAGDMLSGVVQKQAVATEKRVKENTKSECNTEIGTRIYIGLRGGTQVFKDTDYYYDAFRPVGIDLYGMWGIGERFCILGNVTYLDSSAEGGAITLSVDAGIGYAYPVGILMPWIGAKIGFVYLDWPDYTYYYASHADLEYSLDAGLDLRLGEILFGTRYELKVAFFSGSGSYDLSVVQNSFLFMVGFRL